MARPPIDKVLMEVALCLAQRATCAKLAVGCVLADKHSRILGSGYNGVPRGLPHCTDSACPGSCAPAGSDLCVAVHAEQNALLVCRDPEQIVTCYTTHAPCLRCTKMLLNTACKRIVYFNVAFEAPAKALWVSAGRRWSQLCV